MYNIYIYTHTFSRIYTYSYTYIVYIHTTYNPAAFSSIPPEVSKKPAASAPGEINCALTLLCQMIGNIIVFIGATSMVMSTPYKDVAGIDEALATAEKVVKSINWGVQWQSEDLP